MKKDIKNVIAVLTLLLSFAVAQAAWADSCNVTLSGDIVDIDYDAKAISVDGTTVNGIPFTYLSRQLQIDLEVGDAVVLTAKQCPVTGELSACTLAVNGGAPIVLPGNR